MLRKARGRFSRRKTIVPAEPATAGVAHAPRRCESKQARVASQVKMNKIFVKGANEIAAKQQAELNKLKHDAVYSKL